MSVLNNNKRTWLTLSLFMLMGLQFSWSPFDSASVETSLNRKVDYVSLSSEITQQRVKRVKVLDTDGNLVRYEFKDSKDGIWHVTQHEVEGTKVLKYKLETTECDGGACYQNVTTNGVRTITNLDSDINEIIKAVYEDMGVDIATAADLAEANESDVSRLASMNCSSGDADERQICKLAKDLALCDERDKDDDDDRFYYSISLESRADRCKKRLAKRAIERVARLLESKDDDKRDLGVAMLELLREHDDGYILDDRYSLDDMVEAADTFREGREALVDARRDIREVTSEIRRAKAIYGFIPPEMYHEMQWLEEQLAYDIAPYYEEIDMFYDMGALSRRSYQSFHRDYGVIYNQLQNAVNGGGYGRGGMGRDGLGRGGMHDPFFNDIYDPDFRNGFRTGNRNRRTRGFAPPGYGTPGFGGPQFFDRGQGFSGLTGLGGPRPMFAGPNQGLYGPQWADPFAPTLMPTRPMPGSHMAMGRPGGFGGHRPGGFGGHRPGGFGGHRPGGFGMRPASFGGRPGGPMFGNYGSRYSVTPLRHGGQGFAPHGVAHRF